MGEKKRSYAEVSAELNAAIGRLTTLRNELQEAEARCKNIQTEIRALAGGFGGNGRIGCLESEAEIAKRREDDSAKRPIRVNARWQNDDVHVLVKVTAKRIYTRPIGGRSDHQYQWRHDGRSEQSWTDQHIHPDDVAWIMKEKANAR